MKRLLFVATMLFASPSFADVCDHRPSESWKSASASFAPAVTYVGAKLSVFYSIVTPAGPMIGSTAAGANAAGIVGIIPATAGFLGKAFAVVSSPWFVAGGLAVGGIFEGVCYASDKFLDRD